MKWVLIDFKTGTGKTYTAFNMAFSLKLDIIIVGNTTSIIAFKSNLKNVYS